MAQTKFSLDGPAFEESTRQVISPDQVRPIREEEEVIELGVDTHTPPESPAPQEQQREQATDAHENSLVKCIMEGIDACDQLRAFQDYESYSFDVNSGSDSDVPEDEQTDEMEEKHLIPVHLQEEEDPTVQGVIISRAQ